MPCPFCNVKKLASKYLGSLAMYSWTIRFPCTHPGPSPPCIMSDNDPRYPIIQECSYPGLTVDLMLPYTDVCVALPTRCFSSVCEKGRVVQENNHIWVNSVSCGRLTTITAVHMDLEYRPKVGSVLYTLECCIMKPCIILLCSLLNGEKQLLKSFPTGFGNSYKSRKTWNRISRNNNNNNTEDL